jgi:excisionase family DNA binding protein
MARAVSRETSPTPDTTSPTSAHVSDPDYSTWPTKQQAADAIGVTTKSIERFAQDGKLQQARWRRPTGGPDLVVYHPADVARIAAARRPAPNTGFLVRGEEASTPGSPINGSSALAPVPAGAVPGDDMLRAVFAAALRAVSATSQTDTLFVTVPEAAAVTGLTQAYLRRLIADKTLPAIRDRGWRIRRRDLEAL